jgi:pentatricopeptide repeat protein
MSERVNLYTLLHRFNLDEGECNKVVKKDHVEEFCKANCTKWRLLPPPLDVETVSVEEIERNNVKEMDRRCSLLNQWKQMKGYAATYRQLLNALLNMKCTEEAANLCKLMKRDATVHPYPARHYFRLSNGECCQLVFLVPLCSCLVSLVTPLG